eukprot:c16352_g1_i1 orf=116-862(+)
MASLTVSPLTPAAAVCSLSPSFSQPSSTQSALLFSPLTAGHVRLSHRCHIKQISRRLLAVKAEVKYVDGVEAKKLVAEEGYTVLDIRDRIQYEKAHIVPSTHIPVYIENTDNDISTIINRTLHNNFSGLFYGLAYTKPNPDFMASVEKKFSKDSKLLLVCQEGLRSGAAVDKLEKAGFQSLAYISSGLQKVSPGVFDKEGPKELQDAGKGGLVTIQGKISTVLGSVLVAALLFITFFPNQAEQWFFTK